MPSTANGHERFECVASVALALILLETGLLIGWKGLKTILAGSYADLAVPGMLALVAAAVSIVVKEWMYWYTRAAPRRFTPTPSWRTPGITGLTASSIGALVGIVCSLAGFPVMDSVASVVICIFIVKAAVDIFRDAVDKMVDRSCDEETPGADDPGHSGPARGAGAGPAANPPVRGENLRGRGDRGPG
ncbi:MAG: cation diffusion facilitator family transporter [Evtepia gabavorous]